MRMLVALLMTGLAWATGASGAVAAPGQLDPHFGADGVVSRAGAPAVSVVHQRDGGIVAVGGQTITRFNPDGSLDRSFGEAGTVTTSFGGFPHALVDAVIAPHGRIVVVGSSERHGDSAIVLARYLPDGSLDRSFGGDGRVVSDFSRDYDDRAVDVVVRGPKILVAGHSNLRNEPGTHADWLTDDDLLVARYTRGGALDRTLSGTGWTTVDIGDWDRGAGLAVTSKNRILVIGSGIVGVDEESYLVHSNALVRLNANGSKDWSFGTRGVVDTDLGSLDVFADDIALQRDGRIVLSGRVVYEPSGWEVDASVQRFTSAGIPDPTFGGDGLVTIDFVPPNMFTSDGAPSVAIARSGKIVVLDGGSSDSVGVARLQADGTRDASFGGGGDGVVRVPVRFRDGDAQEDWRPVGHDLFLDWRGRIVVGGDAKSGLLLVRLLGW